MFKFFKYKRIASNLPAFSILEIMAVILIVSVGLVGTVNMAIQNIQAQTVNNNNLVAYQLAQESLEVARQIRDTNWMQGNYWMDSLPSGRYCVDYRNLTPKSIAAVNDCPLYLDANNRYYGPIITGAEPSSSFSGFSRMLEVNIATSSASVTAIVSWTSRNGSAQSYMVETQLYDWY